MYVSMNGIINNLVQTHKELGLFSMESGQLLIKSTIYLISSKALLGRE
ncbi:hypothetical protein VCRA2119O147_250013 [Vibrio crassostreae]|nr:hypothetical protein VCRA2119O145_100037 [Vibrio crassostreae]CAK1721467.1 hypothetical protein VCRA2116O28_110122 [Vibrio crassostreae]CAK1744281.1 hypothetical protein VCRA2119O46_130014 [Vibrio crassostreae]CAK1783092.1 hypothetical protein VCRA2114E122_150093 [Vibrio crassostreae]CAK1840385.1 hypothetical protein VCRA2114O367_10022 [Vibrio crassostreae]